MPVPTPSSIRTQRKRPAKKPDRLRNLETTERPGDCARPFACQSFGRPFGGSGRDCFAGKHRFARQELAVGPMADAAFVPQGTFQAAIYWAELSAVPQGMGVLP